MAVRRARGPRSLMIVLTRLLAAVAAALCIAPLFSAAALAKQRHALIIGVGNYKDNSGLAKLLAPANDAEAMKAVLSAPAIGFDTTMLRDDDVANKASFEQSLRRFLRDVKRGDEVLFYFSGHGFATPDKTNYFLLGDAKSQAAYIRDLGPAGRDLDTPAKRDDRYNRWIADVALSQTMIEEAIRATEASVTVMIVDACRSFVTGAKAPTLASSTLGLQTERPDGLFRILSASHGQVSLDAPDAGPARGTDRKQRDLKRETSLFTRVLLQELQVPNLEITLLFKLVRNKVNNQARVLGHTQIPDFSDSPESTLWYFRRGDSGETVARCRTAQNELSQLRFSAASGGISREELLRRQGELAPCGQSYADEIEKLLRFESQGAGALSTNDLRRLGDVAGVADPVQQCDLYASSPFDPNRPQGVAGFDVHQIALEAMKSPATRDRAVEALKKTIQGCETATQARPRVARYKFNLARSHYAYATLTDQVIEREASLAAASRYHLEAADQGYVAAFNDLAVMYQNGEFFVTSPTGSSRAGPDRQRAFDYFKRGADLGHLVAQYNLGLAYKNGELGIFVPVTTGARGDQAQVSIATRNQLAYQYLSRSAEGGYVPAMIETALLQYYEPNLPGTKQRASELLEVAASRGSWEAMFQLGRINFDGGSNARSNARNREASIDFAEAVVWFSRAAEAGDTRAQTRLASLLLSGDGLPAQQPDAAARYLRLAAAAGSVHAQELLAGRLREGKLMFRPRVDGKLDGGAAEIRDLYIAAFSRGSAKAGLELGRLFRTGFPADRPSDEVPKSGEIAARFLWDTIDRVRAADPASADASPEIEAWAAVELIKMFESGESRGIGGPDAITQDQIEQLKSEYGDVSRLKYIRTSAVGDIDCRGREYWVLIWDGRGTLPMIERQFDWFERHRQCKELTPQERERELDAKRDLAKVIAERGIPKRTRDIFKREYEAAQKDKDKKRSFVDRMVDLVSKDRKKQ